jgi:hypothetical protein
MRSPRCYEHRVVLSEDDLLRSDRQMRFRSWRCGSQIGYLVPRRKVESAWRDS